MSLTVEKKGRNGVIHIKAIVTYRFIKIFASLGGIHFPREGYGGHSGVECMYNPVIEGSHCFQDFLLEMEEMPHLSFSLQFLKE